MFRWSDHNRIIICCAAMVLLSPVFVRGEVTVVPPATPIFRLAVGWAGYRPALELMRSPQSGNHITPAVDFMDSKDVTKQLKADKCDVGLLQLSMVSREYRRFCEGCKGSVMGTTAVAIVVNSRCPIRTIAVRQLGSVSDRNFDLSMKR